MTTTCIKRNQEDGIYTFKAQSTLVINAIPGCTASGPLKSLATFSYWGCVFEAQEIRK
jgi:hypothetical protein